MVDNDSQKKEVKSIVYLLAILWILGIVAVAALASIQAVSFSFANLLALVVIPVVMFGLWTFKKWGLMLGYALCFIQGIFAIVSSNIIGLVIWGSILYYMYKNRNIFS